MFITTSLVNWQPLFRDAGVGGALVRLLFEVCSVKRVVLFGYCIMPSHIHMIVGHSDGGPALSAFVQSFKSLSARRLFPNRKGIWQRRFDDVVILTEDVFRTKLNYIHQNPVKAGLVAEASDWLFSSARDWLSDESRSCVTTKLRGWTECLEKPLHEDV
jgi:putative transposase